ncbi:MAG TPA: hypothetical protein DHW82_08605 [Spirochaetia bacterium]|nr:MAG: hypothetical protein A2Y41_04970 [Spirochaetes bacterium GWB1_36_13]HCL57050.1 hypothetical protein [Spirochaetia bacterium]
MLELIQKDVGIIENYAALLSYFDKKKYPDFYEFTVTKTNELLKNHYYREALRFYQLLTLFEKNDTELYKNYKTAYLAYTSSILEIKKAIGEYQKGEIQTAKKKLQDLQEKLPGNSNLQEMVKLGEKEIEKKIEKDYILPGIQRIETFLQEKRFNEAKGYFLMLKRLLKEEIQTSLKIKIKAAEKKYYFEEAEKAVLEAKDYNLAMDRIKSYLAFYPEDNDANQKLNQYKEMKLKAEMQVEAYNQLKKGDYYLSQKQYSLAVFHYKNYLDMVKEDDQVEKKIKSLEKMIEEERNKTYFYENYNKALEKIKLKDLEGALKLFDQIKNYNYEKEKVTLYLNNIREELEKIRIEREKENTARNYFEEGQKKYSKENYREALDDYLLSFSLLNEINGRELLKKDVQDAVKKTQSVLKEIENKRIKERLNKIESGINKGKREYFLSNYDKALAYFNEVLELDDSNIIVKDYKELIEEAQKIDAIGKISDRDPFYPLYLSLKTEGERLKEEGIAVYKNNQEQGKEILLESLNKWQTIKRAFPYNEEARVNIRSIFKIIDEKGWKESIEDDMKRAIDLADKGEEKTAYKLLKELYDEAPDFPKLSQYIKQFEKKQKESVRNYFTPEEKTEAKNLYNQALNSFSQKKYPEALKLTEKILKINKYSKDDILENAKSLYIRIKSKMDTESLESLNLSIGQLEERTKYYREALSFYQQGDFKKALEFAKKSLKIDPTYNAAQRLLDSAEKRLKL